MAYYPAFLDLRERLTLLVGGGQVAGRKLASLLEAGARVRLVSPRLAPETAALLPHPEVDLHARGFQPGDLEGVWLAVCATDDEELNRQVAAQAEKSRVFVNVVDVPSLCSFIVPASVQRGELHLAVSTGGAAPAVARRLRERLERDFPPVWGPYLLLMRRLRQFIGQAGRPAQENRPLFFALADSGLFELLERGDLAGIDEKLAGLLGPGCDLAALGLDERDLKPRKEGLH